MVNLEAEFLYEGSTVIKTKGSDDFLCMLDSARDSIKFNMLRSVKVWTEDSLDKILEHMKRVQRRILKEAEAKEGKNVHDLTAVLCPLLKEFIEYFTADEWSQMDKRGDGYTFYAVATLELENGQKMNGVFEVGILRKPNARGLYDLMHVWFNRHGFDETKKDPYSLENIPDRDAMLDSRKEENSGQYQVEISSPTTSTRMFEFFDREDKSIFVKRLILYKRLRLSCSSFKRWISQRKRTASL